MRTDRTPPSLRERGAEVRIATVLGPATCHACGERVIYARTEVIGKRGAPLVRNYGPLRWRDEDGGLHRCR